MLKKIASFFGADRVVDSGMKIVDKLAGTDFTSKEKAQWVLDYVTATKHQSPVRRAIAAGMIGFWLLLGLIWLATTILAHSFGYVAPDLIATDVKSFMQEELSNPTNLIVGFYFFTHMVKK